MYKFLICLIYIKDLPSVPQFEKGMSESGGFVGIVGFVGKNRIGGY
jgi:hypothetical protein